MKVCILAGGRGTRISEETISKPKPMVEIGGTPILRHIMNVYAAYGHNEFVIALGYKGEMIKEYFSSHCPARWKVDLLDTGLYTSTGGRVKRLSEFVGKESFMLTYGDGIGNVNISALLAVHEGRGSLVTLTAVHPPARFGRVKLFRERVLQFREKEQTTEDWINGGFMVVDPGVFRHIENDETSWEGNTLENLAIDGQVAAYRHEGFWQCVDTVRDLQMLNEIYDERGAIWLPSA